MTTFTQAQNTETLPASFALIAPLAVSPETDATVVQAYTNSGAVVGAGTLTKVEHRASTPQSYFGEEVLQSSGGFDWFESFHVIPREIDIGNLLSAVSVPIEVFSAFRHASKPWNSFTPIPGAGVSLGGAPGLPTVLDPLSGIAMTVEVSTTGDAFVDGTLDFDFGAEGVIEVPIEIQRIVLFGLLPEVTFSEFQDYVTNVYEAVSGKETRESVRSLARQLWDYRYIIEEGQEAQQIENILFDFQSRTFGVPIWFDDAAFTSDVSIGDTVINVESTAFRDFYVGGLVVLFTSQDVFDVLVVQAITATTITLETPTLNAYSTTGGDVYPLATCLAKSNLSGGRWPVNLRELSIQWERTNNDNDYGDLSAFSSYDGKMLLDNPNSLSGEQVGHNYLQRFTIIDNVTGNKFQESDWDRHKRGHALRLRAEGREEIWNLRQMIQAIRGKFKSFYIPRGSEDLIPVADLLSGSLTIDVKNNGYSAFVRSRSPKNRIRITFLDGSPPLLREITDAAATTPTVDQLTVDIVWPSTIAFGDIKKIEYVESVRFDADRMRIDFDGGGNVAHLVAPIKALFE